MTYIACGPEVMHPCQKDIDRFHAIAKENRSGAKLLITSDPYEYIKDVDFTVSDAFWLGFPDGSDDALRRRGLLFPKYRVDQALVDAGKPTLGVMHCLPGMREEDITSEVWDGPNSLLFEEAENRLHAQRAICAWFMYTGKPSAELQAYHMGKVESFLNSCQRAMPAARYLEEQPTR